MRLLVTGGSGFLGSNLAIQAMSHGAEVTVFDNLSRAGSDRNLEWLKSKGTFRFVHGDIRNQIDVAQVVKHTQPQAIFHLAGQVAMTASIANPREDFEINALGTLNLLEAVRLHSPRAVVLYSSTNKVYGDLEQYTYVETATRYRCVEHPDGFDESTPLSFHSAYGCSKGAADQYMLDYARIFGLRTVVFRHSSMYGGRQFSTYDQGWIGWFCQKAVEAKQGHLESGFTISGNGKQVRDVLHVDDISRLYFSAVDRIDFISGQAFNIGGGPENSLSLLELFTLIERMLDVKLRYTRVPPRESDQKIFIANTAKSARLLEWHPTVSANTGVARMIEWVTRAGAS